MWTIIKFDRKRISYLKKDFSKKLNKDISFYYPKFLIQKYVNNKLVKKDVSLLGDYILCYHKDFCDTKTIDKLKFSRGLKYFLNGFTNCQKDIQEFVDKCSKCENDEGYLSTNFLQLNIKSKYKFTSGPFTEKIFEIINLQKEKIDILIGNLKTTVKKAEYLFNRV